MRDLRLPPQNLEAEQGVLGSILLDQSVLIEIANILKPEDFYRDAHQVVYRAILELHARGAPVDFLAVGEHLERIGQYERLGGNDFLKDLHDSVPYSISGKYYAGIVIEHAKIRRLLAALGEGMERTYQGLGMNTADEIIASVEQSILDASRTERAPSAKPVGPVAGESMEGIMLRQAGTKTGIPTGFETLDTLLDGFHPGQVIVLAGRPGLGKSCLAHAIATNVAIDQSLSVYMATLEMAAVEVTDRILADRASVPGMAIKTGKTITEGAVHRLGQAYEALQDAKLFIDDAPSRTMMEIASEARRLKVQEGLDLMIIDYLQLVTPDVSGSKGESRQEQVAKISRSVKQLARDLRVPILALSQLNRSVEERENQKPRLSDLRESGALEQDADVVLFLWHQPKDTEDDHQPADQPGDDRVHVLVAKNRSGPTGAALLKYQKEYPRFRPFIEGSFPKIPANNAPAF